MTSRTDAMTCVCHLLKTLLSPAKNEMCNVYICLHSLRFDHQLIDSLVPRPLTDFAHSCGEKSVAKDFSPQL